MDPIDTETSVGSSDSSSEFSAEESPEDNGMPAASDSETSSASDYQFEYSEERPVQNTEYTHTTSTASTPSRQYIHDPL